MDGALVQAMPVAMTAATATTRATYVLGLAHLTSSRHRPAPRLPVGQTRTKQTGYRSSHDRIGPMQASPRLYATIAQVTNVKLSVCIPYKARLDNLRIALEALAQQTMHRRWLRGNHRGDGVLH